MDKIFADMFSREPDEIVSGDYFYHTSLHNAENAASIAKIAEYLGITPEEFIKKREKADILFRDRFKSTWDNRTPDGEVHPYYDETWMEAIKGKNKDIKAEKIISKIILGNKPFMDIASSSGMGLASYFIKMNPKAPCLITDINVNEMTNLRSMTDEHLSEYSINLAVFDNLDIPIKDNSLDYVTSRSGITSSSDRPTDGRKINVYQFSADREKAISEVYRVLKPGGYFITVEMNKECDYDLQKIYNDCNEHGKLFGLYTYDEIQAVCELLREEPWRDKFTSAGFEIEVEKTYYRKCSLYSIMHFLHYFTNYHGIHHWEKMTWDAQRRSANFTWNINDYDADNAGFDLYETDTFFILRKPDYRRGDY